MYKIYLLVLVFLSMGVQGHCQYRYPQTDSLQTYRQSKINVSILGISFQREKPVSQKNTLVFRAELNYSFFYAKNSLTNTSEFGYSLNPMLVVGGRHYYKIRPVSIQVHRNSGGFIGLDLGVKTPPLVQKNLTNNAVVFAIPYWGIQRHIQKAASFEFGLGLAVKSDLQKGSSINVSPNIQLRIGWYLNRIQ